MTEEISGRLLDQRLRNRMSEALLMLVEWNDTLVAIGPNEYFNAFFDWFPPDHPPVWPNTTLTDSERDLLTAVRIMMDDASEATPNDLTNEQLVNSGWPQKVALVAEAALNSMRSRGQFSEDIEEDEPSGTPTE